MLDIWIVRLTCFTVHAYRQIISVVNSEQLLLINSSILTYIFAYRVKVGYKLKTNCSGLQYFLVTAMPSIPGE